MSESQEYKFAIQAKDVSLSYLVRDVTQASLKEFVLSIIRGLGNGRRMHAAVKNVTIQARQGECVALLGHNGCGKSTFLKAVAGVLEPQSGSIQVEGRIAPLIELGAGFDPELTGYENIFLSCSLMGLSRAEIHECLDFICEFSEIQEFLNQPVKTYSSGMHMRLAFSCAVAIKADVILVDEILAVGDQNFQKKCLNRMLEIQKSGATIFLVSHDIDMVRRMADRVYVMDHGLLMYEGSPEKAIAFYDDLMAKRRQLS